MHDEIFLEADEEVTSAIDKIKKSKKDKISLVLPRAAVLGQSIVNLKLVYKEALASGKEVALVTSDKTAQSLAERIGFMVYNSAKQVAFHSAAPKKDSKKDTTEAPAKPKSEEKGDDQPKAEEATEAESEAATDPEAEASTVSRKRFDEADSQAEPEPDTPEEPKEAAASAGFVSQAVDEAKEPEEAETASNSALSEDKPDQPEETDEPNELEPASQASDSEPELTPAAAKTASPRAAAASGGMIPTRGNLRFLRQQKKRAIWIPLVIIAVLLLGATGAAALMIPRAQIDIVVKAQPFNETVKSVVDVDATAMDEKTATIPGTAVTLEHVTKSSAKATGKKDIGTKASGAVTIYNEWDSSARNFAAGTKIRAKNGNEFVLTKAVTVPGASSTISGGKVTITAGKVDASVEAAASGDGYNNAPTTFTIPSLSSAQQEKIYATSSTAFTGGTTQIVTVVTESDIAKLTENVKTVNKEEAIAKIKEQASDAVIIDQAIQTINQEVSASAQTDQQAESVEVTVTGNFSVITFKKDDQQALLEKLLANKIPEGQELVTEGDGLAPDTSKYELNLVSEKRLELTNNLQAFTVQKFDRNVIQRSLIGSSEDEVQTIVERTVPVDSVTVTVTPSQWPRLPYMANKINLKFSYKNLEE